MSEPIIEFADYTFKYRTQEDPTLKNIDLKIYPGEKILVIGQSGSGKSTLAHCINALNPCSFPGEISGSLRICGCDPVREGVFGISKRVGTVLQDTDGQFIGLTVAEDIAFALENEAVSADEMKEIVNKAAEEVGMLPYLKQSPGDLSGGQKQRVSLAGVMVDDVKILLFDEPLANLDPATGKHTIEMIDDLMKRREDLTVIIIEHRLEDVLYKDVDRIILLGDGRIIADMKSDDILCTDLLDRNGIREPLYIAAIKHAGLEIKGSDHPSRIDKLNIGPYGDGVREWFESSGVPKQRTERETCLQIEDLSFSYDGEKKVLNDISFEIKKGEITAIVGKNGAGKSTLASIICGFLKQKSGVIKLDGEDISPLTISERGEKIGYVLQSPNQMISKPMIYDEVALSLKVRGLDDDEIKRRVNKALKICGLYPYRKWPVSALSFGQKKRVSIASILVSEPSVMILDEPTAGQDHSHYTEIMEFLLKLKEEEGIAVVIITHDMHLMLEYADHAIALSDGKIVKDSTPEEILTDKEITEKACLKMTSLYDLAVKCRIEDETGFVRRFIEHERELREKAKETDD